MYLQPVTMRIKVVYHEKTNPIKTSFTSIKCISKPYIILYTSMV